MQVPEHVVSLYVATCGLNGASLGSDEKEIILLVYVILEATTGRIIGTKQLLVRPDGSFVKDRTTSSSSDTSNNTTTAAATSPQSAAPLAVTYPTDIINNNNSSSNNNNILHNAATTFLNNVNNNTTNITALSNNNNNITNTNITTANIITNNNTSNNNGCNSLPSSNSINCCNGPLTVAAATSPTNTTTIAAVAATSPDTNIKLPIGIAHAAGKPLSEAIEEFDEYLRSLSLTDADDIKFITDGQLPLRQCLHREACAKDIHLPAYYNRFSDLRKEFLKYKSGDLSRALVPVKDIKKILQIPVTPPPQSIDEMLKELNITSTEDGEFYIRESRDMVSVIQNLLKAGHKFTANEIVNLVLEPGICSIDDEIDGNCIVRARGLPWQSSDQDIAKFFRGLNVAKGGVALCLSPLGRRNGEALIRFISQEHRDMALKRHKHHIGNRYIEVYRATGEDFLAIAGGASNEAQAFLSKGAQVIIRMRGLPYDCTAKQVLDFFTNGENPCNVLDGTEGVLFVKKPDGRATGDAFVLFASENDAPKALARHRESIGQRYIELFRSTTAEVQQVLNRSMDPKTYETNHQPPLIAQLPTMQLSLLPQHLITSGTTKNCIRLRGLPYEALVEHILHFLDDFAKHIIYQGVHMVINAQGQPSGEAFIQMDSEESARLCAQRKHNQFMVFGKKYRYIEVFQCSGDDMNMVLNGGLQSPVAAHHPHHPAAGKQPGLLSPGASVIGAPFAPFAHFGPPPTPILAPPHRAHSLHAPHQHPSAAFYPHQFLYWSYPSPPVSPTTYFSQPAHTPTHVAGNLAAAQHQPMYSLEFLPAAAYVTQPSPMSPPSVAIPTTTGLILSPNKTQAMTLVPPPQATQPKQFSPLPAPPLTPIQQGTPAGAPIPAPPAPPNYHNKLAIHHVPKTTPQQQQAAVAAAANHIYHYNSTSSTLPAQMKAVTSAERGAAAVATTATLTPLAVVPAALSPVVVAHHPQTLLSIDTGGMHNECSGIKPPQSKVVNSTTFRPRSAHAAVAAAAAAAAVNVNNANSAAGVVASGGANVSGQTGAGGTIVPNPCVESFC